jgi:hypothetical protein
MRTQVDETFVDSYEDEYLLFRKISDLTNELPPYGRIVVVTYIESVEPIRVKKEKP